MSVYCGFTTRKLEEEYMNYGTRLIRLLCRRISKAIKNEPVDEARFNSYFANLYARLVRMEEQKYSEPKLSQATLELAYDLQITNEMPNYHYVIYYQRLFFEDHQNKLKGIQELAQKPSMNQSSEFHNDFDGPNKISVYINQGTIIHEGQEPGEGVESKRQSKRYANKSLSGARNLLYSSLETPTSQLKFDFQDKIKRLVVFQNGKRFEDNSKFHLSSPDAKNVSVNSDQNIKKEYKTIDDTQRNRMNRRSRDFHDQIRSMMKVQKNKTSTIYKQNVLKGIQQAPLPFDRSKQSAPNPSQRDHPGSKQAQHKQSSKTPLSPQPAKQI